MLSGSLLDTLLNIGIFVFVGILVWLLTRRDVPKAGGRQPEQRAEKHDRHAVTR